MQNRRTYRYIGIALVITLLAGLFSIAPAMAQAPAVFINEIHYDNDGTDAGEAIEVAGPAGTDLADWSLVLYNGSNGTVYNTFPLSGNLPDQDNGYGTAFVATTGLQNGGPDGLALVYTDTVVAQFLSYEGAFTAVGGAADGMTSTDIGVAEGSSTPIGASLQLVGTGSSYADFTWSALDTDSFGAVNTGQSFDGSTPPVVLPDVRINEVRIDQPGGDDDEYFELAGAPGTSLDGLTYLVIGDGTGGSGVIEAVVDLTGQTIPGSGYFVAAESSFGLGTADLTTNLNFENSDNVTHLLVVDFSGANGDDLDTNDDGTLDVKPWAGQVDLIALLEEENPPSDTEFHYGPPSVGPDGYYVPGLAYYCDFGWQIGGFTAGADDTPGAANDCTFDLPLVQSFDNCALPGWEIISVDVDTDNTWSCSSSYGNIEANGYGDSAPADEWLITPALDMDAQENEILTFRNQTGYSDADYPQLEVFYSTDYDEGGDPTTATWTELTGINFSPAYSWDWVSSGKVDISGISGDKVYFGFHYFSSGTSGGSAATWRLDDISIVATSKIHEVQGDGAASPYVGQTVAVEGIVVGDFQDDDGDTNDMNGFFIQEEDFDADADALTSEGIFIYDGSSPNVDVAVGDKVYVVGDVSEYFEFTEITSYSGVFKISNDNPLPTASVLSLPVSSVDDFEAFEGMLVTVPQPLYISEYYNFGRYGEMVLTSERQFQPSAVYDTTSPEAFQLLADNALDRITLDDGRTNQNPDPAIHPNGDDFAMDNLFRGGDTVANVTGVISYSFDLYRIQPTQGADYYNDNPRTASPDYVGDGLKVASFNVLNYFTTVDTGDWICGPTEDMECRGADDAEELARQRAKIVAAIAAIDADVVGLIEIENNITDVATADLVSGLNDLVGAGTYDYIATGAIGTDAIRQAFIYKTAAVTPVGDYATLETPDFLDPLDSGVDKNRPALAQTFFDNETGGIFTAVVNHLKSKGSACDGDVDDIAGNCNLTRTLAAQELANWLGTYPTGVEDEDFLIIGDLNAYDKEDPIDVLIAGGFEDQVFKYLDEYAYSYVFDGQLGYLDHALANAGLDEEITGVTIWHINADEPSLIDYDTSFKQDAQDALYADDPYRSSDHDPVIVGMDIAREDFTAPVFESLTATPDELWPANHKYVDVTVTAVVSDNVDPNPIVTLVSVESNEPDDGLGDGDTPIDIVIVDDFTFQLRAERSAVNSEGRTYTITYQVTDFYGNPTVQSVTVYVPFSQGD